MKNKYLDTFQYQKLLFDVRKLIELEKAWLEKSRNQIKIHIYWKIGERIGKEVIKENQRADYGENLVALLAQDLKIEASVLFRNLSFYRCYPYVQHISYDLTWSHYRKLITIKDNEIRRYYEVQTIINTWSVRDLDEAVKKGEHHLIENIGLTLPNVSPMVPDKRYIFKECYDFAFVDQAVFSEEKLEHEITQNIANFLAQLGYGFSFMGNQKKIIIGNQVHRIDMLFFHTLLCCYVIIELKIEPFRDEFVGQINKYLNYFREKENLPYMQDPIGLIICQNKNKEEVYYALGGLQQKIFVAQYSTKSTNKDIDSNISKSIKLSKRQQLVLKSLQGKDSFNIHEYHKKTNVSLTTAKRDLKALVEKNILYVEGQGKKSTYKWNKKEKS